MSIYHLDSIFRPRRIAVVGASDDPSSVGFAVFRNLERSFEGELFPVNPSRREVAGVPAFASVGDIGDRPDLAVVCSPARTVASIIESCGEAGVPGAVVISAGFGERGPEGKALEADLLRAARRFEGLRIIGPNCLGVIFPRSGLNATFASVMPEDGRVAFVSQSGAVCASVLDWAREEEIGFSCFVSIGNMIDVDFGDLIDYLAADSRTEALVLYVESITEARKFMSAARAFTRTKPIVAYKAGRFPESAKAAASHTGALAGEDAVYEAAFERAGIVRIQDSEDLFDCAEILARQRAPRGERLAIVTNAGGPGVMATDALMARGGTLAHLSDSTMAKLNGALPAHWSKGNPVDVLGDASPERYTGAAATVLEDDGVDAMLAIFTTQAMTDPTATARRLAEEVLPRTGKPMLAAWMGGESVREGLRILSRANVPAYATPEHAVRAFLYLVSFSRRREILYETPREIPVRLGSERAEIARRLLRSGASGMLSEIDSKALLEAYGIAVTRATAAATAEDAVQAARDLGYPVVLKILSPQITHKTDVGGVALGLERDDEVRKAFDDILTAAARKRPDAVIRGVTVQRMRSAADGVEMILGTKKDPTFGSAILVGMGGVAAELFRDRALGLPPLNERLAWRMLTSLRSWPLLEGYRGRPGANLELLLETLIRFSYLVAELPEIRELDINPLLVTPREVVALDARIAVDEEVVERPGLKPYSHLVIRPYPESFAREKKLPDGTSVLLRPIRPEDEPLWSALLESTSNESLLQRFRQLVRRSHELAARFCFIDYDREMAIVAEVSHAGERELAGVGRLVADPDHRTAEYAVLVTDRWQGRGLGALLTEYCVDLAPAWGVTEIVAYTTAVNMRALKIFHKLGFQIERKDGWQEIEVRKRLS
jgi:acetyltransferase